MTSKSQVSQHTAGELKAMIKAMNRPRRETFQVAVGCGQTPACNPLNPLTALAIETSHYRSGTPALAGARIQLAAG